MKFVIERPHPTEAAFYGRVSTKGQTKRGDGLNSQEACAREYAKYKGYNIVASFHEEISGE